jgi:hypothetical protein
MQLRVKKVTAGRLVGDRFVASRQNPSGEPTQPLGRMAFGVMSLATPAGITKSGKLRKNPFDFTLQKKAQAADDRFQKALEKEYGRRAGDMRYRTSEQTPRIRQLAKAFQKASEASHNYTTKYQRATKGRSNPLTRDKWMPAKVKITRDGLVDVLMVGNGKNPLPPGKVYSENPMKPYPEAYSVGRTAEGKTKAQAAKEFEAWYDYRQHHIDSTFSKAQFKAEFMRGWKKVR